jgi:hypothetical protein
MGASLNALRSAAACIAAAVGHHENGRRAFEGAGGSSGAHRQRPRFHSDTVERTRHTECGSSGQVEPLCLAAAFPTIITSVHPPAVSPAKILEATRHPKPFVGIGTARLSKDDVPFRVWLTRLPPFIYFWPPRETPVERPASASAGVVTAAAASQLSWIRGWIRGFEGGSFPRFTSIAVQCGKCGGYRKGTWRPSEYQADLRSTMRMARLDRAEDPATLARRSRNGTAREKT